VIDEEIRRLVQEAHERARSILTQHRDRLKRLAAALLEKEVLDGDEAKRIVMSDEPSGEAPQAGEQAEPEQTGPVATG
jgi:cell division protease FtsH